MVLNSSPRVKKTWEGILVLLLLSSVTLGRSMDWYPSNSK